MEKLILIKYGELSTKKGNIGFFLDTLKNNVKQALEKERVTVLFDKGRMFITHIQDFDAVLSKLQKVFGIHEFEIGYKTHTRDYDLLKQEILELLKEEDMSTFKVVVKRSDKTYPISSTELARKLGGFLLANKKGLKVDVHQPQYLLNVEVRSDAVYVYWQQEKGLGGYPVGALGKGLLMLSGGIDSPVAGYLAMKRGVKIEAIYFESPPHTSLEAKNKVITLAKKLAEYNMGIKLHVIRLTEIQEAIYKNIPHEYLITILRRMMYRISAIICKNNRGHILINGESIGQVASQTLTSMEVINQVVSIPVIRPLACFDKLEIIDLANKIGTYETSILPFEDCCTIFVPEHPVIHPLKEKALEYETLIPYEELIYQAIKEHEVIRLGKTEDATYEDLL